MFYRLLDFFNDFLTVLEIEKLIERERGRERERERERGRERERERERERGRGRALKKHYDL